MTTRSLYRYTQLPDLPGNMVLNACRGPVSVVKPVARTNMITNPSFETATTNYTAVGGSIARSTTQQYHGAYSLAVTPGAATTDGVRYDTVSLTSGTTYAASCKFYGVAGLKYKISFATTGGVDLSAYTFTATGRWQWVYVYWTETSSTTRRIYFTKNGSTSTAIFYIDGVQVESLTAGERVSTFIDGDQLSLLPSGQFPPCYGWNGTRHASTSYRTAQTRDGGMVYNLDEFNFAVTGMSGLGLRGADHIVTQQGFLDGSRYQTSVQPQRDFTISGRFTTRTNLQLKQARAALGAAIGLDRTAPRQPIALLYQEYDGTTPIGLTGKIVASYNDGLAGTWDNTVGEQLDIPFTQWSPYVYVNDGGATMTQSETITVTNITNLMYRDVTGDWSKLSDFAGTDEVLDIVQHPDGTWYVTGAFTTIGGVSANRIARYDPVTGAFSALGTGLNAGQGNRLFVDPQGNVYVGGNGFTTANGVTVNRITYWNGTTFVALGSGVTKGVNNTVYGITMDASGNLYVCGIFTQAGGGAAAGIAKLDTAGTWSALGTGLAGSTAQGFGLTTALNGTDIYVGGDFTTANGVASPDIAKWNGTTFEALGSGVSSDVRDILTAPNGDIYATGDFTTAGGNTVNRVARWNGTQWSALSTGLSTSTFGSEIRVGFDGLLYVGGAFTAVGGITTADSFAAWNGSSWLLPDIDMAGSAQVDAVGVGRRGELMVSFFNGTASNASAAQLNTLTNDGTVAAYPIIRITGPSSSTSRLHVIRSYTTGEILNFNLTIFALEEIAISTGPDDVSVTSLTRGDLTQYVLPGSSPNLRLLPGANSISYLVTGGTVTTVATWAEKVLDASDLVLA
jgi:carbohydrate binding protein with CBM4/9 domain/beta-propeller uncharacterized protein DUF5122